MDALPRDRMTAAEFLDWSGRQPEGKHYELVDGLIVESLSERALHARVKLRTARSLEDAIGAASLPCEVFGGGMAVRVNETTVLELDAAVRCGAPLDDDAIIYDDPVIVVEVISPSSSGRDRDVKLDDCFSIPTVLHYLILRTENRRVIHHARDREGRISTHILSAGPLVLDPPGLTLEIESLFPKSA